MTIRPATTADAVAVHAVVIEAWRATVDPRSSGHRFTVEMAATALSDGLGPRLVAAVEAVARERAAARVLLAVSVYSPGLVPWYEQLGYRRSADAVYSHASPTSPVPFVLTKERL